MNELAMQQETCYNTAMPEAKRHKEENIRHELQERTVGYIVGAFGIVAGLAWNEAVKALIEYAVPLEQNTLLLKFFYAIAVTVIVVLITAYLTRVTRNQ